MCVPCLGADVIINSPLKDSTRSLIPCMPILTGQHVLNSPQDTALH